jgi:putative membrane protein insertion efficiency factor
MMQPSTVRCWSSWSGLVCVRRAWELLWVRGLGLALSMLLIAPIRLYQWTISPMLGDVCRYHPSCSRYAVGALRTHGPLKGLTLASYRLVRCTPFTRGGLDPVPPRGMWRPAIHPDGRPRDTTTGA